MENNLPDPDGGGATSKFNKKSILEFDQFPIIIQKF